MRRAALLLATFAVIYVCNFFIPRLMPGDPLQYSSSVSGEDMTVAYNAEQLEQLRAYYGLDQPLLTQFGRTLAANLRGDLGQSIHYKQPVSTVIVSRLPWTLGLMAFSTALSLPLAVGLALLCVRRPRVDKTVYGVFSAICQLPPYLVGLALLFLVAARVDWLPLSGGETAFARYAHFGQRLADLALHGLLPAVSLCVVSLPGYFFTARASFLSVRRQPYLLGARSRGLKEGLVRRRYILRNAATPIVAKLFLSIGGLMGSTLLVENVFAYPGVGTVLREAVRYRDYPLIQGVRAGSRMLRRPWRRRMVHLPSPLARAKSTYSLLSTSVSFCRVCRAMLEKDIRLRVMAGRARWYSRCQMVTSASSTPMGLEKPTGNHPRVTAKISSSTSPSQKVGTEESR